MRPPSNFFFFFFFFVETDLTFNRTVDMATAREAALRDVQAVGGGSVHSVRSQSNSGRPQVFSSKGHQSNGKFEVKQPHATNANPKSTDSKPKTSCTECGNIYWKNDCPLRMERAICEKRRVILRCVLKLSHRNLSLKSNVNFF